MPPAENELLVELESRFDLILENSYALVLQELEILGKPDVPDHTGGHLGLAKRIALFRYFKARGIGLERVKAALDKHAPSHTPAPDPGGSPGPAPDPGGSPGPAPDPGGSPGPAPDPGGSPGPAPDPGGSPGPAPDPGGSPGPAPDPDGGGWDFFRGLIDVFVHLATGEEELRPVRWLLGLMVAMAAVGVLYGADPQRIALFFALGFAGALLWSAVRDSAGGLTLSRLGQVLAHLFAGILVVFAVIIAAGEATLLICKYFEHLCGNGPEACEFEFQLEVAGQPMKASSYLAVITIDGLATPPVEKRNAGYVFKHDFSLGGAPIAFDVSGKEGSVTVPDCPENGKYPHPYDPEP